MSVSSIPSIGRFELWMLANAATGFVGVGGMMFLIPLYVLSQQGTPADAGSVMAVASALALAGPFLGGLADRFNAYRGLQLTSIALLVLAAVSFSFAREELTWLVAAALLGLGMAGLAVVNPTFVVGAGLEPAQEARKLGQMQMMVPFGQVLGLAVLAGLSAAGLAFEHMFWVLAAVGAVLLFVVAATNRQAAQRLTEHMAQAAPAADATGPKVTLRSVLVSPFGLVLLMALLITAGAQGIESQYPNYMQSAFDIDPTVSAGALSLMVLLSIPLYPVAGRLAASFGPRVPFLISAALRTLAGIALVLLPKESGALALVVFAFVMLTYSFFELGAAALAAQTSRIGAGAGQGALGGALALGTMAAAILAGWLAQQFGYPSLAIITAVATGAAVLLGVLFLRDRTPKADLVAVGGRIHTVDDAQPWASAVAVKDGLIAYVGDDAGAQAWIGPDTQVVALDDHLVLPGFVESHVHVLLGAVAASGVAFAMSDTAADVLRTVREFADANPQRQAIFGVGYDADMFDERGPDRRLLDEAVADRPVILLDHTMHGAWANSRALEMAGVTSTTADPLPSVYVREADGTPTGAIKGSGASLPVIVAIDAVPVQEVLAALPTIVEGMSAFGFTAAFDMGNPIATRAALDALLELDQHGRLPMRVSATTLVNTPHMAAVGIDHQRESAERYRTDHLWFDTLKIMADSVINNQTAALLEPYVTTGERGSLYFDADTLRGLAIAAADMGHGVVIHTLGDRAVRTGLDVAQEVRARGHASTRYIQTHCEVVHPDDLRRFAELDVLVQTTSNWALATPGHAQHLGHERNGRDRQPMRSWVDSGAVLALGADWPATPGGFEIGMNPFVNIFTAMHRRAPAGLAADLGALDEVLAPADQVLTLAEAIAAYTICGARAMGREHQFGSIAVGKSADMIVVDRNLFDVPAQEIAQAQVLVTMFEGRIVHDAMLGLGEDRHGAHDALAQQATLDAHACCR